MEEYKKINRKDFLRLSSMSAGALLLAQSPLSALAADTVKITILHTNDWHSRIDPFPKDGSKFEGQGGAALRARLIEQIRQEEKHVLVFDAGDIVQGTPYYNFYEGEPEIRLMNQMGYQASAIGNHDFDNGLKGLAKMAGWAQFPFLCCNYDFSQTPLSNLVKPSHIYKIAHLKIGVFGVGISPDDLISPKLFGETRYLNALQKANETAAILKHDEGCDLVVCLSHLGFKYNTKKLSDEQLARGSENIDIIIGGHTHTFLDFPASFVNKKNNLVTVNQVGWAGLRLGRLDCHFTLDGKKKISKKAPVKID